MLSEKSINELAKLTGIDAQVLKDAQGNEAEVDLTIPEGLQVFTPDKFTEFKDSFKANVLKENQATYEDAKRAGLEMAIKEKKQELGLEFDGKDLDSFTKHYQQHVAKELGKEPDKKINELTADLDTVRGTLKQKETEYQKQIEQLNQRLVQTEDNTLISGFIPDELPAGLNKQDATMLFMANHKIEHEDGKRIFYRNGQKLADEAMNPYDAKHVVNAFINERGWTGEGGKGRGAGGYTGSPSEFKSMNDVMAYLKDNNIDPLSTQGQRLQDEFASKGE
jgi:hypothetical protein